MDWMYLVYFLLGGVLFAGARFCRRGEWNEDYTSLGQTKVLLGFTALCIALHHLGQKHFVGHHTGLTVHLFAFNVYCLTFIGYCPTFIA